MQESCPPPRPPPSSSNRMGGGMTYVPSLGVKRNFAALHPWLKMHRIADSSPSAAPGLPQLTQPS